MMSADKSGSQPPLSHFADFKVFNERGEVDFTHKYEGGYLPTCMALRM
jgi:hypothetical protein